MDIVIIGAVAAGAKAAAKVKRLLPDANVKIYTNDTHVSYSSCGLPYFIEGNFSDYKMLLVRSPEEFRAGGISVNLEANVEKILPETKNILVSVDNKSELVKYDKLIIATGASPFKPEIAGINDYDGIFTLRKIEDGINIKERMQYCKNIVIIGGGYIGIELLEAFVRNGIYTTLIHNHEHIMSVYDPEISDIFRKRLETSNETNFAIYTNEIVSEFSGKYSELKSVKTLSGKEFPADMAIICAGVVPNTSLAKDAGIELGIHNTIRVNKLMRTSVEDIYACGDCAEKTHIVTGQPVWIPLGSTANKEGRCAAMNAVGVHCEFEGVLGSAVTRCLNTTAAMTGLTEKEAIKAGFTPITATVKKYDKVPYMPEASEMTLKVVADKITGLLLGAQAVGPVGADKRVNTITSALIGHLTVDEFSNNDLTYSPPYSTTIDPLLNAMQILCQKTAKHC